MTARVGVDLGSTTIKWGRATAGMTIESVHSTEVPTRTNGDRVTHPPHALWKRLESLPEDQAWQGDWQAAVTSQRSTFILWDERTGDARTPLISWRDRRAEGWVRELTAEDARRIQAITGLRPEAGYPLPKLMWLFRNRPELRQEAEGGHLRYGSLDSWIVFRATGGDAWWMDHTQASRTLLYNPVERSWSTELFDRWNIPQNLFPPLIDGVDEPVKMAKLWPGAELVSLVGDQPASTIGGQAPPYKDTRVTLGTGGFVASPAEPDRVPETLTLSFTPTPPGTDPVYQAEGVVLSAGRAVDWWSSVLDKEPSEVTSLAPPLKQTLPLWCPSLNGVGAPFWSDRPGACRGIEESTSTDDLTRGLLVSILLRVRDILLEIPDSPDAVILDGGLSNVEALPATASALWDRPVRVASTPHLTLRGALICSHWYHPYFDRNPYEQLETRNVEPASDVPVSQWIDQWQKALEEWGLPS